MALGSVSNRHRLRRQTRRHCHVQSNNPHQRTVIPNLMRRLPLPALPTVPNATLCSPLLNRYPRLVAQPTIAPAIPHPHHQLLFRSIQRSTMPNHHNAVVAPEHFNSTTTKNQSSKQHTQLPPPLSAAIAPHRQSDSRRQWKPSSSTKWPQQRRPPFAPNAEPSSAKTAKPRASSTSSGSSCNRRRNVARPENSNQLPTHRRFPARLLPDCWPPRLPLPLP